MSKKEKKSKKNRGKTALKVIGIIAAVIVAFIGVTTVITVVSSKKNTELAKSFDAVKYENQLVPEKEANGCWTFTTDEDFKVVQLTDVHIGGGWMSIKKDAMALNAVAAMLTEEKPDLVIVTGDVAYPVPFQAGTFNNKTSAKMFAELMETLGVYWTMTMGNHDTESYSFYSRETMGDFYQNSGYEYCLFEKGPDGVDGVGNQAINIKNSGGVITQSLFTFDSHSYTDGDYFGFFWKYDNIHDNQVKWYSDMLDKFNDENDRLFKVKNIDEKSDIKSLAFFHIPLVEQHDAWMEYAENGYKDTENVKLLYGVAGETGRVVYCGMHEDNLFETMLEKDSTKGIFVGHDHRNNFSIDYKGIRFTYGMSVDYLAYPGIYKYGEHRGCTVIDIAPDGSFDCRSESYYQDKYAPLYEKESVTMQEVTYPAE